jgi:hypothetical protein
MSLPLKDALRQCSSHAKYLQSAMQDIPAPITEALLETATPNLTRAIDQMVLRFIKMQDAMGEHVLRGFAVNVLLEPIEDAPLADVLSLLDKHHFLSLNDWLMQRKLRNALTHEYPDQTDRQAAALNATLRASEQLIAWLATFEARMLSQRS